MKTILGAVLVSGLTITVGCAVETGTDQTGSDRAELQNIDVKPSGSASSRPS